MVESMGERIAEASDYSRIFDTNRTARLDFITTDNVALSLLVLFYGKHARKRGKTAAAVAETAVSDAAMLPPKDGKTLFECDAAEFPQAGTGHSALLELCQAVEGGGEAF
ncbi:hypothetical protein J5N58_13855 [Rhizobium cremeum]|uniref:hypothetical protein n=1 Tax=Rhizobium cremeum TaxID=2813827 RepID=UPI001FD44A67|nr:hypothetical protein [Rhizobium cremeum]MCJ8000764.1 hypothetical protein [Rhizobium cremeum]